MIPRDELGEQAENFDLNEADIQRDYVFGWLISGVFSASELGQLVALKGGNALRKGYLPYTRFSHDLDFTTERSLESQMLLDEFNKVCDFVHDSAGVVFDMDRNRLVDEHMIDQAKKVYKLKLYFKDFMGRESQIILSVRLDVTEFDRLYLPIQERQLIHPYSDADACSTTIRCVKLEEALADKLKLLLQRRHSFDLFDLVHGAFLSQEIDVDRSELMSVFMKKTIFGSSPLAAKQLLLDLPTDLIRGYWSKVVCPAPGRMSFDKALEAFKAGVEELFGPAPAGAGMVGAFFPSRLRNPILQAGADKRLLRLTYDSVTRVVEPYSLAFKRRVSDNVAQEYFYVWDRTGGRTSGPGIKALFHNKIHDLQVLEETFEPRYAVELGKAGDASQAGYFRGTRGPRSRSRRTSVQHRFIVTCLSCGRDFRRTKRGTRMNPHKDSYGNNCPGRRGIATGYL